jgi:predicted TIM-barrel fold metal-dependent hydrolase
VSVQAALNAASAPPLLVDAHCHLDHRFGGGWSERPATELIEVLDAAGVHRVVDLSGGWGLETLHRHLDHFKAAAPDRFTMLGGIDLAAWPEAGPRFGVEAARSLEAQLRRGASGLKVWKDLGLTTVDERQALVAIDDPRLDPVWQVCADQQVPVVIHVGDPPDFFEPLGPDNPRSAELSARPDWHWHARGDVRLDDLAEQFERLLDRWPSVSFIGAHALDLFHAPRRLRQLLTDHANLAIDVGARFSELATASTDLVAALTEHPLQVF